MGAGTGDQSWGRSEPSLTGLVGRERELAELRTVLDEQRLVTVTGPGGVGKTSLALAALRALPDGVRVEVCELAEVRSPDAVRHAVAASLGIAPRPGMPLGAALTPAAERRVVLLDNCEHVLDAAADVADELVATAPQLRVVATSREPLGLPGERALLLAPLAVPESADDTDAAEAAAVVLFGQRARLADAGFRLDARTLPEVVRICRALDGLPLALEIAAARVRVLDVRDIADRLGQRFVLLRSGTRRTPDRHRSLRAAVDWSYELLRPDERDLFCALAVHPAGCALPAATAAGEAAGLDAGQVVDVLDGLVAKSLLTLSRSEAGTRYRMLETLREYGLERLHLAGTLDGVRDRQADYYAGLTDRVRRSMLRAWTPEALPLFAEFDNLRAVLTWTLVRDDEPDRSFALLAPMWYVALQQRAEEVAELAGRALARWPDPGHPLWSEVAGTAATAQVTLEDFAAARVGAEAALAAGTSEVGSAFGWLVLAAVAFQDDDPAAVLAHLDRADAAAVAAGFDPLRCDILGRRVPALAQAGRTAEALVGAERALALAETQGNVYERAWAQHMIGLLLVDDQPAVAHEWLRTALAASRTYGYVYGTNSALRGLALASAVQGDLETSAELFGAALDGFIRSGHLGERWNTVAALLVLLVAAGRSETAAALLAGLDSAGVVLSRIHAPLLDRIRDELAAELRSARIRVRGQSLSAAQLLALARHELRELRPAAGPPPQDSRADAAAVLQRTGDLWRVSYAGTIVHLPDLRGIRDLAVLLARPGTEIAALDLAAPPAPATPAAEDLAAPGDLGDRIDARARAEYAARIRELQAELDDADAAADPERSAQLSGELDALTTELSAAYGLHGPRRTGDPAEKARSAVTARIRAAIAKIREAHPALGAHLGRDVHTGRFCSYRPEPPVSWQVTP